MKNELSDQEIQRYQRQLSLPQFGEAAQKKLKNASVLVVGAGGLGCPVLQYLAAAGVGTIGIVDDDSVSLSNLPRQILFNPSDIGKPKAILAEQKIVAINPHLTAKPYPVRFSVDNALTLIEPYDLVIDCTDNFPSRYLINDACLTQNKVLIYGALYTYQGQASVFNWQGGPTYRCLFPEPPRPEDAPNCSEIGVLGVLPGLVGVVQATETIKVITGIGEPLSGKLWLVDALTMEQKTLSFQRLSENNPMKKLETINYQCKSAEEDSICQVSPSEVPKDLESIQLLDVREYWEHSICALPGSHIPLGQILQRQADFSAHGIQPDRTTYVYCKVGVRSLKAAEAMRDHYGFQDVRNLSGGILEWAEKRNPNLQIY